MSAETLVNRLLDSCSMSSCCSAERSGKGPEMRFQWASKIVSSTSWPMDDGIGPFIMFAARLSADNDGIRWRGGNESKRFEERSKVFNRGYPPPSSFSTTIHDKLLECILISDKVLELERCTHPSKKKLPVTTISSSLGN